MDSKKIEELANGAEKDIEILNEMYEKYAEIKDGDTVDDDTVINNICFNLINAQTDIDELQSQIQQLQERNQKNGYHIIKINEILNKERCIIMTNMEWCVLNNIVAADLYCIRNNHKKPTMPENSCYIIKEVHGFVYSEFEGH